MRYWRNGKELSAEQVITLAESLMNMYMSQSDAIADAIMTVNIDKISELLESYDQIQIVRK